MTAARLFERAESRLEALEHLTPSLWLGGITHSQGTLEPRLFAMRALHAELFAGRRFDARGWTWPEPAIAQPLERCLHALELHRFCQGQGTLCDTVLLSVLFHLDFIVDYQDRGASRETAIAMALSALAADWQERGGQMDELMEVFGQLPDDAKQSRWDLLRGLLRSSGWQKVLQAHQLMQRLPGLARLIDELGRGRASSSPSAHSHSLQARHTMATIRENRSQPQHVPDLPGQTRGLQRSDRIARMLPSEALLLGHARLRLLWHARRAERALLCYEDDAPLAQARQEPLPLQVPLPSPQPAPRAVSGPLLVCVDTSGSMQGGAEALAKAVVLEAMRSALRQGRACHVFAFGGEQELLELELELNHAGLERLCSFLGQAFGGGTDICGPLERVLAKLQEVRWQRADLLLATDGEFGATPAVVEQLEAAKAGLGLRVQGVLIGDRETVGLLEVCDHIYAVQDWRRLGGQNVDSPVHSTALTALYFPAALRSVENRVATVSGAALPAAVRAGLMRGTPSAP